MTGRPRWFIAGAAGAALVGVVGVVAHRYGIQLAAVLVGIVASLVGLLGGLLRWGRRSATAADIEALDTAIGDEALKRSVGALPDLVSRHGMLDLGVEPRLRLVHDPSSPSRQMTAAKVDDVRSAFAVSHRRLLIVGEPASGKTIAAYRLANVIAEDDTLERVPLLINLSAWADQHSFEAFLVDYLCAPGSGYGITNRNAAQAWVARRRFTLILDGLDEAPAEWRIDLLARMEDWLPVGMPVVLTCRTREYNELNQDRARGIALALAVELQPLDDEQLDSAFTEIAVRGEAEWSDLVGRWKSGQRQAVREALCHPLILNLAVSSGVTPAQLRDAGRHGREAVATFVIDEYLDSTLQPDPSLRSWTMWIARYLTGTEEGPFGTRSADETVFDLGRLTPPHIPRQHATAALLALGLLLYFIVALLIQPSAQYILSSLGVVVTVVLLTSSPLRRATSQTFKVQKYWLRWPRVALLPITSVLCGLAVSAALAVASLFANTESRQELLLARLVGLTAAVNIALADTLPDDSPEAQEVYASELNELARQAQAHRASEEATARAELDELLKSFEATADRFREAQEAPTAQEDDIARAYGLPQVESERAREDKAAPSELTAVDANARSEPIVVLDWMPSPLVFAYPFGIAAGLLFGLWILVRPRHYTIANSLDGPWRQSRRSASSIAALLWIACGLPVAMRWGFETGMAVGLLAATVGGLSSGGWFLMIQRLAWSRLHREHGLDRHPLSVLQRGTEPRAGVLPLLRPVGAGVRFIHNDVRDGLAYNASDDPHDEHLV